MKEQDQQIALCEWMGWTRQMVEDGHLFSDPTKPMMVERWVSPNGHHSRTLPDTNSLDVLHSLEEKLDCDQRAEFYNRVAVMVGNGFDLLHAKPELRRKAILQTLNLWREDSNEETK